MERQDRVKRIIFIVCIFLLFILMAVRIYYPAYANLPPSLKSLLQMKNVPQSRLYNTNGAQTNHAAVQMQEDNGAAPDQLTTQNN